MTKKSLAKVIGIHKAKNIAQFLRKNRIGEFTTEYVYTTHKGESREALVHIIKYDINEAIAAYEEVLEQDQRSDIKASRYRAIKDLKKYKSKVKV